MLRIRFTLWLSIICVTANAAELFNNGPLITHVGQGFGGANVSAIQTSLGSQLPGYGIQWPGNNRVADDFVVPSGGWVIDTVTLYSYQLNTGTTPTVWDIRCRIWNGRPDLPTSQIVWGNMNTNRLLDSAFSGIYRAPQTNLLASDKAIMAHSVNLGVSLGPGSYWLEWSAQGLFTGGPWAPPVTRQSTPGNGNALQFYGSDQQWHQAFDHGGVWVDDFPFVLHGPTSGSLQTLPPTGATIGPGSIVAGTPNNLAVSDDLRMNVRPGAVAVATQRPIVIVLESRLSENANQLRFVLEASASVAGINQQIEFFNFQSGAYDPVADSRTATTIDQSVDLLIPNPSAHISPDGLLRTRISAKALSATPVFPWVFRLDQAVWRYTP